MSNRIKRGKKRCAVSYFSLIYLCSKGLGVARKYSSEHPPCQKGSFSWVRIQMNAYPGNITFRFILFALIHIIESLVLLLALWKEMMMYIKVIRGQIFM